MGSFIPKNKPKKTEAFGTRGPLKAAEGLQGPGALGSWLVGWESLECACTQLVCSLV